MSRKPKRPKTSLVLPTMPALPSPTETPPAARGRGRPRHEPDDKTLAVVKIMAAGGMHVNDIAAALLLAPNTVRRHYQKHIDSSAGLANAQVVAALFRNAVHNNNVVAQIWWTKSRMGWTEKMVIQDGGFAADFNARNLSDDAIDERIRSLRAAPVKLRAVS